MSSPAAVLEFWFGARARARWFATDPVFDDEIRGAFGAVIEAAARGDHARWADDRDGALALAILFDQFPRNLHRGSPRAFEHDARARAIADAAIRRGFDLATPRDRRLFFYLPFQHSEALVDQERSVELSTRWVADHADADPAARAGATDELTYVARHREIIERFGRFPHRNAALGRPSTPAELAFLADPASSF